VARKDYETAYEFMSPNYRQTHSLAQFIGGEKGMQVVVRDDEILDNSIMRDLFFLGKALGQKYRYLRLCYNFFMFGLITAVLAFGVTFIIET
jgi:hypothetical protein